jgi:hypothetical protein
MRLFFTKGLPTTHTIPASLAFQGESNCVYIVRESVDFIEAVPSIGLA